GPPPTVPLPTVVILMAQMLPDRRGTLQGQAEQDLSALHGHPPADQDTLGGLIIGAQLQVDRIEEAVDDVVLLETTPAPLSGSLPGVLTDAGDRGARRDRLLEDLLERRLHIARREAPKERADHQRLQGVRAGHALAEHPALKAELARITDPRTLQVHRPPRVVLIVFGS